VCLSQLVSFLTVGVDFTLTALFHPTKYFFHFWKPYKIIVAKKM